MGETIRILAVKPKTNQADILKYIVSSLEESMGFTIERMDINKDYPIEMHDNTVQVILKITFNSNKYTIKMSKKTFKDENLIVDLIIETSYDSNELNDGLYHTKITVKNDLNKLFKGVYWQKDTQNEKACSELYSIIHVLENRFRELIVQFMVNKFGFEWTKKISEDLQGKIISFSNWYRQNYQDFKSVKTELFNLQIDDLMKLLESSYDRQKITEKEFINAIISEEMDSDDKNNLIDEYKININEKDIWNKYFVDMLDEQFPKKLGIFEKYSKYGRS